MLLFREIHASYITDVFLRFIKSIFDKVRIATKSFVSKKSAIISFRVRYNLITRIVFDIYIRTQ